MSKTYVVEIVERPNDVFILIVFIVVLLTTAVAERLRFYRHYYYFSVNFHRTVGAITFPQKSKLDRHPVIYDIVIDDVRFRRKSS